MSNLKIFCSFLLQFFGQIPSITSRGTSHEEKESMWRVKQLKGFLFPLRMLEKSEIKGKKNQKEKDVSEVQDK